MPWRWVCTGLLALTLAAPGGRARAAEEPKNQPAAPILHLEGGPNTTVYALAYSPDGRKLYVAGYDKVVQVWTWDEGQQQFLLSPQVYRIPLGPGIAGVINTLAVSPDGEWLAVGGRGVYRSEIAYGQSGKFHSVHQLPLVERQDRGLVYLLRLDPRTGQEKDRVVLRRHEASIRSLAFGPGRGPKGPLLVSVSNEPDVPGLPGTGRVCLWDVEEAVRQRDARLTTTPLAEQPIKGVPYGMCPGLAIRNDGPGKIQIAMAWSDGWLRVWNVPATENGEVRQVHDGIDRINNTVAYVPGAGLLTGGDQRDPPSRFHVGRLQFWDASPGQPPAERGDPLLLRPPAGVGNLLPVALALVPGRDRQALLIARTQLTPSDSAYRFLLVDLATGKILGQADGWKGPTLMPVLRVAPKHRQFVVADAVNARVQVYSLDHLERGDGRPIQVLQGKGEAVEQVALMRGPKDGSPGLYLRGPATPYVFDFAGRQLLVNPAAHGWRFDSPPRIPRARPAGKPGHWQIDWWDEAGQPAVSALAIQLQPDESVTAAALVPAWQGARRPTRLLALATRDAVGRPRLQLYDPVTGRCVRILVGHSRPITSLAAGSDGKLLASASEDHTVCLWSMTDLDEIVGRQGAADGFAFEDDPKRPVLVVPGDPTGAAAKVLGRGDTVRGLAFAEGEKGKPVKAAGLAAALWGLGPDKDYWLDVTHIGGRNERVRLRTTQGVDARTPLLSLFVGGVQKAAPEWIAWTAAGKYDRSAEAVEGLVGWHFNPDRFGDPVQFAPLKDHPDFYEKHLLGPLVRAGELSRALQDIALIRQKEIPWPAPQINLLEPGNAVTVAPRSYLVRDPNVTLRLDLDPFLKSADIDSVRLFVNEREKRLDPNDFTNNRLDVPWNLSRPGVYTLKLVARSKNPEQGDQASAALRVRYQLPQPELTIAAARGVQEKFLDKEYPLTATVKAPGKVNLRLLRNGKEVWKQQGWLGKKLVHNVELVPNVNRLRLEVQNAEPLAGYEEDEQAAAEHEVIKGQVAPPRVTLTRLLFRQRNLNTEEGEDRTVSLEGQDGARPLFLPVRKFRLEAEVASTGEDLTQVTLRNKDTGQALPVSLTSKRQASIAQDVTLGAVGKPEAWVIEAVTRRARASSPTLRVECRPELPRLILEDPRTTRYQETAKHERPQLELWGRWILADEFAPFDVQVSRNGFTVPARTLGAAPEEWKRASLTTVPLVRGDNALRVVLKNRWHEQEVAGLHATWSRTPVIVRGPELTPPQRKADRVETTLTAEVEAPADVPPTEVRAGRRGSSLKGVEPAAALKRLGTKDGITRWLVTVPGIPVTRGTNDIALEVANADGGASDVRPVVCPIDPNVVPPQVVLAEQAVQSERRHYELAITVHSVGGPLTRLRVFGGQEGKGVDEVAFAKDAPPFGPPSDRHWLYTLKHTLSLTRQQRPVTIRAENAGGETSLDLTAVFVPPPPVVTFTTKLPRTKRGPEVTEPQLTLEGQVTWAEDQDPETIAREQDLLKKSLRVYVNDFRQLRPRVARVNDHMSRFAAEVVLNQDRNDIKLECPGLSLGEPRQLFCAAPHKSTLYLVVVDVNGVVKELDLVNRVQESLKLAEPEATFKSNAFAAWRAVPLRPGTPRITPLHKSDTTRPALLRQLAEVGREIARSRSPADVVLIYWLGPEGRDPNKPGLQWRDADDVIPLSKLLAIDDPDTPEPLGARILLLDVPEDEEKPGNPVINWKSSHAGIIRYAWAHGRKVPGLLQAMETVAQGGRMTLDTIVTRAEKQVEEQSRSLRLERVDNNLKNVSALRELPLVVP